MSLVATGLAVLAIAWLIARPDGVRGVEARTFSAVNALPDALAVGLWPIMQLGTRAAWIVAPVIVFVLTRRVSAGAAVLAATMSAWIGAHLVKSLAGRPRPEQLLDSIQLRTEAPGGAGFVSAHAAIAFALAVALLPMLPRRWRGLALGLAVLVGVARVYFGAHLPADVVGGAGIGVALGAAAAAVTQPGSRAHRQAVFAD